MRSKILSTVLVSLSVASFSPVFATHTEEDIKGWTAPRIHDKAGDLLELIQKERLIPIAKNIGDQAHDYGFSFPGVNPAHELCLTEICQRYTAQGARPRVLDLGAGHGLMTWKMLVSGGHVTAVEFQKPTAQVLQKTVMQAKPFLDQGELVKDVCQINLGSVLNFDTCLAYKQEPYDVTWSGNIIHLLPPEQAAAYVENLFKITNSGGCAFATVHAPCLHAEMIERFLEQQEAGNPSPGYFIVNKLNHRTENHLTGATSGRGVDLVGPFPPAPQVMPITLANEGFYGEGKEGSVFNQKFEGLTEHYTYKSHTAMHCFDTKSLSSLFEAAGFIVEEVFFMDRRAERYDGDLSVDVMSQGPYAVGIKARKP